MKLFINVPGYGYWQPCPYPYREPGTGISFIERKPSLKLLGVTFQSDPCNWDLHLNNILSQASSRLYILRVCKFCGIPLDHLHLLFISLILPIHMLWKYGAARFIISTKVALTGCSKEILNLGYCKELFFIEKSIIALKDKKLWDKITDNHSIRWPSATGTNYGYVT